MADADVHNATDPQENPTGTGHLPVSGEVGSGPVSYHDPVTQDTDDSAENAPSILDDDAMKLPVDDDPAL